jgi:hypothetical protein
MRPIFHRYEIRVVSEMRSKPTMKIFFSLPLLASTACAFVVLPSPPRHSMHLQMYENVEAAIADAQRICAGDPASAECKVAWDIVEELEAADSHKGGIAASNVNVPSADLEFYKGGLDILLKKIDGKMDQLKGTTEKMAELGSADPAMTELWNRAVEMKEAVANARGVDA